MVQLTPCPRCKDSDWGLSVPAAYSSARSTESARGVMRGDETTFARRSAARATVNAALPIVAAKDLAMAPDNYGRLAAVIVWTAGGYGESTDQTGNQD